LTDRPRFPHLARFSRETGISEDKLVSAFEIEQAFHTRIVSEDDPARRRDLYREVYETVHPIYGEDDSDPRRGEGGKERFAHLFRREIEGRSILDVGCGAGDFLRSVARRAAHGRLVGLDISTPVLPRDAQGIEFVNGDVVRFDLGDPFDVVLSDNLVEHVAPADLPAHFESLRRALKTGGTLIVMAPSRLFGPCDVTRIVDCSYTNRVAARGTHLSETTYGELIVGLGKFGFARFRTVCPIPKVRFLFAWWRMSPAPLCWVERHMSLIRLLHRVQLRGRCVFRLDVTLIARAV